MEREIKAFGKSGERLGSGDTGGVFTISQLEYTHGEIGSVSYETSQAGGLRGGLCLTHTSPNAFCRVQLGSSGLLE